MEAFNRLRYRFIPYHVMGEILTKRWTDNAIPLLALLMAVASIASVSPSMFTGAGLVDMLAQMAEFGLLAIALTVVMISGGVDLSIGSIFALCAMTLLSALNVHHLSLPVALALTAAVGALCGAVNGLLIGYLRLRAFLTTLVTLILFRSIYDILLPDMATEIVVGSNDSTLWTQLSTGQLAGIPYAVLVAAALALAWHMVLSRMRLGWHLAAVGGTRKSAFNAGIPVRRVVFGAYVCSGLMCAVAAVLFAARLGSIGSYTGVGYEISVLTAVVLGGTTLGGGRGSVAKTLLGSVTVLILSNGMMQMGLVGSTNVMILGVVLLAAAWLDGRWTRNRHKLLSITYVSPAYLALPPCPSTETATGGVYAVNERLREVEIIGLGAVEGPEDVVLDRDGNLYCGSIRGDVYRFFGPDHKRMELFAHIGGTPVGMNINREGDLVCCVGAMGLYKVTQRREVVKLTDETQRSPFSIIDDSRLRLADDMDFAPDGRVFFSEATVRYNIWDWPMDWLESRGNGRILCYDPRDGTTRTVLRNLVFANGICCLPDGESLLFAETWACRISRLWYDGPKKGTVETLIDDLPGYPDNINRASDGTVWLALCGMRAPAVDLAQSMPGFRRRMSRRVASSNFLFPNLNTGCVLKVTLDGKVIDSMWDRGGHNHPMITSIREHKGYLYIGGVYNNRIGKWKIPGADPNWTGPDSYWGPRP